MYITKIYIYIYICINITWVRETDAALLKSLLRKELYVCMYVCMCVCVCVCVCVYTTKRYIYIQVREIDAALLKSLLRKEPGKSQVYLLYWYKSTNTDANAPGRHEHFVGVAVSGNAVVS
jgi:hypothetical protein